ncbi:MAG: hypothetical protein IJK89_07855 [Clostridia bacterium]|nr:hypothetical protein [Clostridia bacterium]
MNKTAKIISVILAVVMALSVLPFAAFAAEEDADRVAAWKANYGLLLEEVFDNTNYTSWNYVDQNKKAIDNTMAVYTAFALYDGAWTNYASKSLNIDDAEKILLALIEKADYTFDDGYVDEIVKVLETAQDVNDFIQKVNQYTNIEAFSSAGWSKTFEVIGDAVKIANAYQTYRDKFIEAYARVLSVQMANAYYIDMLNYIVEKDSYDILTAAAQKLINDINASVEDALKQIAVEAAEDGANVGLEYLAKLALNSNAYTAAALKVYQVSVSIADALWNTGDQYPLIDTVKTAYYFQADIAEWAKAALNGADAEKAIIAANFAITAREVSEDALYNLKLAENEGAINKIKNKLYGTVYNDIEVNKAILDTIRKMLYNVAPEAMKEVKRVLTIYCPVDVELLNGSTVLYKLADGAETINSNDKGVFVSVYSEYAKTYHKVAFLYDTYRVRLAGTGEGYVTLIMDALKNGAIEDWSFTDRKVEADTKIVFDTDYKSVPYYVASDANGTTAFNADFVPSEQKEVTVQDVITATTEVGKQEAKSFLDKIMEFFQNLFANLFNIFKK